MYCNSKSKLRDKLMYIIIENWITIIRARSFCLEYAGIDSRVECVAVSIHCAQEGCKVSEIDLYNSDFVLIETNNNQAINIKDMFKFYPSLPMQKKTETGKCLPSSQFILGIIWKSVALLI